MPASSTSSRSQLMRRRNGYASSVTGGSAGPAVYVTNDGIEGPGSLRAALEAPGPAWVGFDASGPIEVGPEPILVRPDKTIDGRGRHITITMTQGGDIWFDAARYGPVANLIFAYLRFSSATRLTTQFFRAGANGHNNSHGGADLVWLHHLGMDDNRDTCCENGFFGANLTRWTADWCDFGPNPGPLNYALDIVGGTSPSRSGKAFGFGFDKTLDVHGVDGDQLTPGYGRLSMHHCLFDRCNFRQPKLAGTCGHLWANLVRRWGPPDGTASSAQFADTLSSLLSEFNIFEPYAVGDEHWWSTYEDGSVLGPVLVTAPNRSAIWTPHGSGATIRTRGNWYLNGAVAAPDQGDNPVVVPYSYSPVLEMEPLRAAIMAGAGPGF